MAVRATDRCWSHCHQFDAKTQSSNTDVTRTKQIRYKVRYRRLHGTLHVKRASFLLGVGAFSPKFYGNEVIPCQNVENIR